MVNSVNAKENSLDALQAQFSELKKNIETGKIISTSLTADSKPNKYKFIALSVLTFGIYYGVYKYQHDRKRIFKKVIDRLDEAKKNYTPEIKIEYLSESERKKLEKENQDLEKIKSIMNENQAIDFLDQSFLKQDGPLEGIASTCYKQVLKDKVNPQLIKEEILKDLIVQYEKATTIDDQIIRGLIKKVAVEDIQLKVNFKEKRIDWEISLNVESKEKRDYGISQQKMQIIGNLSLPSISKEDLIKKIDSMILSRTQKLENAAKNKQQLQEGIEKEKARLKNAIETISAFIGTIWSNSHLANKDDILFQEIIFLKTKQEQFLSKINKIETQSLWIDL